MNDLIRRSDAIDALHMHLMYRMGTVEVAQRNKFELPEE